MSVLESNDEFESNGAEEAVRVFVRIRPLNKREIAENQTIGWNFNDSSMLEDTPNGQRVYAYDQCFGPNVTNKETYETVGKPVVLKAMEGYNGTVFTYGQTGSGKTWTMRGCESDPGMMFLCIRDILGWIKAHPNFKFNLRVAYLEVYNEEINDLLGDQGPTSKNLKIVSEDAVRGAVIGGLVEELVESHDDFMKILQKGEASRSYASTNMNAESSRSHTIYRVSIEAQETGSSSLSASTSRISYLNLVDLAGSERQKHTKADGKILKEGANINRSLLALGAVINKLGDASKKVKGKGVFIPYRDSKLTRILKQSLGGNTLTSVLCAVTPAPMHREETVSTLKFGQLCKNIKNTVKANDCVLDDKALVKQYRNTINDLRAQIEELTSGTAILKELDPDTALGKVLKEKTELEIKVRSYEAMIMKDGDGELLSKDPSALVGKEEIDRLNDKISEQQRLIAILQQNLEEFQDLEDSKAAFEEYEHNSRQELEEEHGRLEEEKQQLQNERYKMLKDRSNIEEKESRIGLLITNLDEKESKLRQMMGTMKEQQDQWQRSINDLQRREDLVEDWQKNHRQREKRLQELDSMHEKKFAELNKREADLASEDQKQKILQRELQEREQKLQIALSRVSSSEERLTNLEEKLNQFDTALKKRESDCDIRERELTSRRKEMESWDALLREKDRKISLEQKNLDERELAIRASEEKSISKEKDLERRLIELRGDELMVEEKIERYDKLLEEIEKREKESSEQMKALNKLRDDLNNKEYELESWETELKKLEQKFSVIEEREAELEKQVLNHKAVENEFYNVKVAQISAKHAREISKMESLITQQLKIASDFQNEMEALRSELSLKATLIEDYEENIEQRNKLIESLKDRILQLESSEFDNGSDSSNVEFSGGNSNDELEEESKLVHSTTSPESPSQKSLLSSTTSSPKKTSGDPHLKPNGMNMYHSPSSSENFLSHLASAQQVLYHILEKQDALPHNSPSKRFSNSSLNSSLHSGSKSRNNLLPNHGQLNLHQEHDYHSSAQQSSSGLSSEKDQILLPTNSFESDNKFSLPNSNDFKENSTGSPMRHPNGEINQDQPSRKVNFETDTIKRSSPKGVNRIEKNYQPITGVRSPSYQLSNKSGSLKASLKSPVPQLKSPNESSAKKVPLSTSSSFSKKLYSSPLQRKPSITQPYSSYIKNSSTPDGIPITSIDLGEIKKHSPNKY